MITENYLIIVEDGNRKGRIDKRRAEHYAFEKSRMGFQVTITENMIILERMKIGVKVK